MEEETLSDYQETEFESYEVSVALALDAIGAAEILSAQRAVLVKPNLVNSSPFPITTSVKCCEEVVKYIKGCSAAEIVVGEGCGSYDEETNEVFDKLGYGEMAEREGIELLDLNYAATTRLVDQSRPRFPEMHLPKIAMSHYLISIPVLKRHSLSDVTGSMKNMMGLAPPEHYAGGGGSWKKAVFHSNMHQSIIDLCSYRSPDMTLMDATVGMAEFHLGGAHCDPPVNKLVAGYDALAIDRRAAELLGLDWRGIGHLKG